MALFGIGDVGNNAKFQINNIPVWMRAQMEQAFQNSNGMQSASDPLMQSYIAYLNNIISQPNESAIANPNDVRAYGQQISPMAQQFLDAINSGNTQMAEQLAKVLPREFVTSAINGNIDNLNTSSENLGKFNSDQINGTFGDLQKQSDNYFNDKRTITGQAYDKMAGDQVSAYGDAYKQLDSLLPRGDLAAAASSRAWAPAMAAAQRRLRAAGIDPNSPEANDILQQVDINRARSADDILSNNLGTYVSGRNQYRLGLNDALTNLNLDRTGLTRGDMADQFGTNANIATTRSQMLMGNEGDKYNRQANITDMRNTNIQNDRNLGIQDVELAQNLQAFIQDALSRGVDVQSTQFQQAFGNLLAGMEQKNKANAQVGQQGNTWQDRAIALNNQGGNFGNLALQGFEQSRNQEAQSNGWLGKMLPSLAGAALTAIFPGSGAAMFAANGLNKYGQESNPSYTSPYGGTPPFMPQQSSPGSGGMGWQSGMTDFVNRLTNKMGFNNKPITSQIPISPAGKQAPWQGYYNPNALAV